MELLQNYWPLFLALIYFGYRHLHAYKVKRLLPLLKEQGALVLDVRSESEYMSSHAPGSLNIPLNRLGSEIYRIPKGKPVVVCCASGTRSAIARKVLQKNGFKETYNIGSWRTLSK